MTVVVEKGNERAKGLYEKCGFTYSNDQYEDGQQRVQLYLYFPRPNSPLEGNKGSSEHATGVVSAGLTGWAYACSG